MISHNSRLEYCLSLVYLHHHRPTSLFQRCSYSCAFSRRVHTCSFSPAGIVISPDKDRRGQSLKGGVTAAGTPVIHHVLDVPGGNATAAAMAVAGVVTAAKPPKIPRGPEAVQFGVFRTILQVGIRTTFSVLSETRNLLFLLLLC